MKKLLLLAAVLGNVLIGSATNTINNVYDNANLYTAGGGNTAERIGEIDVNWLNGPVSVVYGDVEAPTWQEYPASSTFEPKFQMYYRVYDGKLKIQFCQSGHWKVKKDIVEKSLVITLPQNAQYNKVDVENVNGAIVVAIETADVDVETVNGSIEVHNLLPARKIDAESVNGSITVYQPSNMGFTAEYETVLGKFSTEFEGTYRDSKRDGEFTTTLVANTEMDFETVNGSIRVKKAE